MASGSLARRYAKAVMGLPNGQAVAGELRVLAKAMADSAELVTVLTNPAIRRGDRRKVIDALLQRIDAQPNTKNLVYLLLDSERMSSITAISRELDAMIEAKGGRVSATITSAKPLDPAQISSITAALEKLSGKKVDVTRKEDPALLGGVVAKVGDVVYDGSLRTQLRTLREELTK
ncbi:MAG: ATP synthase F1 subunit delta [Deltaproteobacteria bacterium]|nr:ATP synthase F1 subunit delta [Deltaproteobacteria bacterium]